VREVREEREVRKASIKAEVARLKAKKRKAKETRLKDEG